MLWSRMRSVDRKSTRLNSSHLVISYAVFCLKKKKELARVRLFLRRSPRLGRRLPAAVAPWRRVCGVNGVRGEKRGLGRFVCFFFFKAGGTPRNPPFSQQRLFPL